MTEIEERLAELKPLGAGDEQCAECLAMKIEPMNVCKQCIADTPAFTELVNSMMRKANVPNVVRHEEN